MLDLNILIHNPNWSGWYVDIPRSFAILFGVINLALSARLARIKWVTGSWPIGELPLAITLSWSMLVLSAIAHNTGHLGDSYSWRVPFHFIAQGLGVWALTRVMQFVSWAK